MIGILNAYGKASIDHSEHSSELSYESFPTVEHGVVWIILQEGGVVTLGSFCEVRGCKSHFLMIPLTSNRLCKECHKTFSNKGFPLVPVATVEGLGTPSIEFRLSHKGILHGYYI